MISGLSTLFMPCSVCQEKAETETEASDPGA